MNRSNWINGFGKLILLLALSLSIGVLSAQFSGGAGTLANPYQIANARDLNNIRGASYLDKYYIQTADINLVATNPANVNTWSSGTPYVAGDYVKYTPGAVQYTYLCIQATSSENPTNPSYWVQMWESAKGWKPIGDTTEPFHGVYDGNGKVISNLYIARGASPVANNVFPSDGEDYVGLFGLVSNGSNTTGNNFHSFIRNLGLLNPNVTGRLATGTLVGRVLLPYTLPARSYTVYVEKCYAIPSAGTAQVRGFGAVGGLVGANNSDSKQRVPVVRLSFANVAVSATHPNNTARNPNDPTGTSGVNNPYNIKFGGLVGCNENGITQDSFARGNVSGGDRVGGLIGCTIGGAVFRSYSTGTVAQGIVPGNWEGGIGGLVGRVSGTLPPGLGGTVAAGSCEDCFWDTQTSGTSSSPGGSGRNTTQMKTQSTFTNWDFVNVWGIDAGINDGYPYLRGNANVDYYFRTKASGNWNNPAIWEYSPDNSSWSDAVVYPDESNSVAITVLATHSVSVTADVYIDQTTVQAGGFVTVNPGVTLYVDNGIGTDLTVNGTLTVTGSFVPGISNTMAFGTTSQLVYNGSAAQSTGTYFTSPVYNLTVNNPGGLTFTNAIQITNVLTVLSGTFSGSGTPDGFFSPGIKYLEIDPSGALISGFGVSVSTPGLWPDYVNRQWNITGSYSGNKYVTFRWTDADDNYFDWSGLEPAVFVGAQKYNGTWDTSGPNRWIRVIIPATLTKGMYSIGRDDNYTLPVELSSFTASMSASNYVMLKWVTQSEANVLGFRIYRSGFAGLETADMLNVMIPATNTSQAQYYSYHDTEASQSGTYYYWLQNMDLGGTSEFHGPVSVTIDISPEGGPSIPQVTQIQTIYPNPFNPSTTIAFSLATAGHTTVSVFNNRGQMVRQLLNGPMNKGNFRVTWDGMDAKGVPAASGNYRVVMQSGGKTYSQKAVLLK